MTKFMVDRPSSPILVIEGGKGKGRKVIASYFWGAAPNGLPEKARVLIEVDGSDRWIGDVEGPFNNLDEVDEKVMAVAVDWFERGNQ